MPIPPTVLALLRELDSLVERLERHPWGTVSADRRYPRLWEANRALVTGPVTPGLEDVCRAVAAMRDSPGALQEHVTVADADADGRAVLTECLLVLDPHPERFVLMVLREEDRAPPGRADAEEVSAPTDVAAWRELKRQVVHDHDGMDPRVVEQRLRRDAEVIFPSGRRLFVVRRDGRVAAIATLHSLAGAGYIDDVATAPEQRRRGAATALVRAVVHASRRAGDAELALQTDDGGEARRLYHRLGFRTVGALRHFHAAASA